MARFKSLVQIPQSQLKKWKVIRKEEDARAIAERAGVTRQLVYLAFNTGKCQQYLLDAMTSFYDERLKMIHRLA